MRVILTAIHREGAVLGSPSLIYFPRKDPLTLNNKRLRSTDLVCD